jgi:hypothetical protein
MDEQEIDDHVRDFFEHIFLEGPIQAIYENVPLKTMSQYVDEGDETIILRIVEEINRSLDYEQTDITADVRRAIGSKLLEFFNRHHLVIRELAINKQNRYKILYLLSMLNSFSLLISDKKNKTLKDIFFNLDTDKDNIISAASYELLTFDYNNQQLINLFKYENFYNVKLASSVSFEKSSHIETRTTFLNIAHLITKLLRMLKTSSKSDNPQDIPFDSPFIKTLDNTINKMLTDACNLMIKTKAAACTIFFKQICQVFGHIENAKYAKYINSYLNKLITLGKEYFDINENPELIHICAKNYYYTIFMELISIPDLDLSKINLYELCSVSVVYLNKVLEIVKDNSDGGRWKWLKGLVGNKLLAIKLVNTSLPKYGTLLEYCLINKFHKHSLALIEFPYTDLSITFGRKKLTYVDLSNDDESPAGREITRLLKEKGLISTEERINEELRIEEEEYKQRVLAEKRELTSTSIKGALQILDFILNEEMYEGCVNESEFGRTCFQYNMCPFCLDPYEKYDKEQCIYVPHRCTPKYRNEQLLNLYFGDEWRDRTKNPFGLCIDCGRPVKGHGHYTPVRSDSLVNATIMPNRDGSNHWRCNNKNGGGGRLERYTRVIGILDYLKNLMDTKQRIVKNPSLMRHLAQVANDSLFDERIKQKARDFIETGELNSVIKPYVMFNAPIAGDENNSDPPEEGIHVTPYINLKDGKELKKCSICGYRRKIFFRFHTEDQEPMCINCVKDNICSLSSSSSKWGCGLCSGSGNTVKNTVMKSDIENIVVEITNKLSGDTRSIPLCEYPEPAEDAAGEIQNDEDDSKEYTTTVVIN